MNKQFLKTLIKILTTVILLGWFLYRSDLSKVFQSLIHLSLFIIFISNLSNIVAIFIATIKWQLLIPQYKFLKLLKINFIGQYYALVLPGQLVGEFAKAYILGKGQKDAEQVAASVLIDKITAGIGIFLVGIVGLILTDKKLPIILTWGSIILITIIIGVLFSIRGKPVYSFMLKNLSRCGGHYEKLDKLCGQIRKIIEAWYNYSRRLSLICCNILLGTVCHLIGIIIILLLSNDLHIEVSFIDWCWIMGALSFILLLPITIGGIGLREASLVGILGWRGVSLENALALSFSLFSIQIVLSIIGCIVYLIKGTACHHNAYGN
jgi:hypothetical protein